MIVEFIAALIEQDLFVGHNHYELVSLRAIIHDVVPIFWFRLRKYVRDAPAVKPDGYKPGEDRLHPDDPCYCIAVDTDESPTCVTDVIHQFFVHYDIHGGMDI